MKTFRETSQLESSALSNSGMDVCFRPFHAPNSKSCFAYFIPLTAKKDLHFIYYGFETRDGPNTTLILAAGTGAGSSLRNLSATGFGSIFVFDNPLRTGPTIDSELVGYYTGTAVAASLQPIITTGGVFFTAELVFNKGSKYEGSRITVIGTVGTADPPVYKLLVLGGLDYFLGCTGYVLSHILSPVVPPLYVFEWEFFLKC